MITKAAILISAVLVFAGVAAASSLTSLGSNDSPTITTPTLSTGAEDVSGPCDEPEHANDPRCTGVPAGQAGNDDQADDRADDRREAGEDVRGPCDELEHANDPRCTGVATGQTRDDDGRDDRGRNSGPGGDDSGHHQSGDDSGHRGGDDSGHGGGNSGHGGSDD